MVNVEGGWSQALESEWVRGGMMPLIGLAPDTLTSMLLVVVGVVIIIVILFAVKPDNDLVLIIISSSFINQQLIRGMFPC